MTRDQARVARAIAAYSDLDNRIRAARAIAGGSVAGSITLAFCSAVALGQGGPWGVAARVWLPLAAAFAVAALVGRVNLATLEARQAERIRLAKERGKHSGEYRQVAACYDCNQRRNDEEHEALKAENIEELWKRSGSVPLSVRAAQR